MKSLYFLLFLCLLRISAIAQSYEYGLINDGNNHFSVIANPSFTSNSDISDIGFTLTLPTGNSNIINLSQFNGRSWSITKITAQQLTDLYGLGDGTKDYFILNITPGQTILSHASDTSFTLASFDIDNMPTVGEITFLTNNSSVAIGLNSALNSFYNSNIDNTTTKDYFGGLTSGQESFSFETLGVDSIIFNNGDLNIYPNPSSKFVSIKTQLTVNQVLFYDMSGKCILISNKPSNIPIEHLSNGMYIVKILTSDNNLFAKRFIKQ